MIKLLIVTLCSFLIIVQCGFDSVSPPEAPVIPQPFIWEPIAVNDGYGDYMLVPEGGFQMGDNFREGSLDELPVHTVTLDAFYIGKFEVTNEQFAEFLNDRGVHSRSDTSWIDLRSWSPSDRIWVNPYGVIYTVVDGYEDHPVTEVSWFGASEYAVWLSEKTGKSYRLPTDAEWEKAARGDSLINAELGHQRRYPWGDEIDGSYADYHASGVPRINDTTPVGYYDGSIYGDFQTSDSASPYGVYDMANKITEWVSDWFDEGYYSRSPTANPTGPATGSGRVKRGGGGFSNSLRSANRNWNEPNGRSRFRCVREF